MLRGIKQKRETLPKEFVTLAADRQFKERKVFSWKLDDDIGICFHDEMNDNEIEGGH